MNFGLDDIWNNTVFGIPVEELQEHIEKIRAEEWSGKGGAPDDND